LEKREAPMFEEAPDRLWIKRRRKNNLFSIGIAIPAIVVLCVLAALVIEVVVKGSAALNLEFFTAVQKPFGDIGGGIANGIIGTVLVLGIASLISIPLSLAAALFLVERKGKKLASALHLVIESFQGIPSIVLGVVIYSWIVVPMRSFSALAGGIALSFIMIPTVTTTVREVLLLVPSSYAEAAISLGAPRWKAATEIVLLAARPGILNAVGLGIARIAGETAPLLFTAFGSPFINLNPGKPTAAVPLIIYEYMKSPYDDWHQKDWGAALLLVIFVFLLNLLIGRKKNEKLAA
jgi:phosphate transport system permease protein